MIRLRSSGVSKVLSKNPRMLKRRNRFKSFSQLFLFGKTWQVLILTINGGSLGSHCALRKPEDVTMLLTQVGGIPENLSQLICKDKSRILRTQYCQQDGKAGGYPRISPGYYPVRVQDNH